MILVTGGAGYIGSHCILALIENGYDVHIFDNLSTGHIETVETLKQCGNVNFTKGDLKNNTDVQNLFKKNQFDAVMHFAAFSQVGESVTNPKKYYENNVGGTLNLLNAMVTNSCKNIVFSSTAAVYGNAEYIPIDEKHPKIPLNPYGKTKLMIENILDDYDKAYGLKSVRLRYFNASGADRKLRCGEWHNPETHLIPNILKSVFQQAKPFTLFGDDYDTKDGTCIRDYIDVQDLANAHILALKYLQNDGKTDFFNLGTEFGYSVKEVFELCEKITGQKFPLKIEGRRAGDPAKLIADNKKARQILNWIPEHTLDESIENAYNWISANKRIQQ